MRIFKDVEGIDLPVDDKQRPEFSIHLASYGVGEYGSERVSLEMYTPEYFETLDTNGEADQVYVGSGVLSVPFLDVLEEYATNAWEDDHGESIPLVIKQLKEFTEKLEKLNMELSARRDKL